ncbi:MAG TPA: carboxymuconolactone decarboxylase family protein [Candidatus Baltobacteraceae bacterium]|jgi:AhpD family alkylhydroperoxidase|nr:carboxymuconolactone decarboxylase family protein [Candidatus Baltobacteraceae bacterium]
MRTCNRRNQRADLLKTNPAALEPIYNAERVLEKAGLDRGLLALVDLRVSQINGCAFCLALHRREAEAAGEGGDRLNALSAWRESPWYSDRERAALEWAESLTTIADNHVPDDTYRRVSAVFPAEELMYLTLAVATINSWNRFCIAFRESPERADEVFRMLWAQRRLQSVSKS